MSPPLDLRGFASFATLEPRKHWVPVLPQNRQGRHYRDLSYPERLELDKEWSDDPTYAGNTPNLKWVRVTLD